MFETKRSRDIAEGVASVPGLVATVYAAIAYDKGVGLEGMLVRMFSFFVNLQVHVFGGDTYSAKLAILMMAIPLALPPALAVRFWIARNFGALPAPTDR